MKIPMQVLVLEAMANGESDKFDIGGILLCRAEDGKTCVAAATDSKAIIVATWPETIEFATEEEAEVAKGFRHLLSSKMADECRYIDSTTSMVRLREDAGQTSVMEAEVGVGREIAITEIPDSQDPPNYPPFLLMGCWAALQEPSRIHWKVRPELLRRVVGAIDDLTRVETSEAKDNGEATVILTLPQLPTDPLLLTGVGPDGRKVAAAVMPIVEDGKEEKEGPKPSWDPGQLARRKLAKDVSQSS